MAYNILIVDDSKLMRQVIGKTIQISGVAVGSIYEAENGKEALEILSKNWIDIVFADINMPEMNGIEMVRSMAKSGILKTVPVVIVSTERNVAKIAELKEEGVKAFINKPFTPESIRNVICGILGSSDAGS
jgi:two-component system chemotaxis response regulator CheY